MKYNTQMIIEHMKKEELECIFFWGHTRKPGFINKSCFSQWYECIFEAEGRIYYTAEQYMMAQKALLFQDEKTFEQIMAAEGPKEYKALGRKVKPFDPQIWDRNKYQIVVNGNLEKFSQNEELLDFLLGTGDKILVEASPYDGIWGVNLRMDDPRIQDPNQWRGENLLGFALMEVRDLLRERKK